jgi:hypothetical protein
VTAKKEIPTSLKQVEFDAILLYNESHQIYRPTTDPPFVGTPSPEIDAAWEGILGGELDFLSITAIGALSRGLRSNHIRDTKRER